MAAPVKFKNDLNFIKFPGHTTSKLIKWKIKYGSRVSPGCLIGFYESGNGAGSQKLKSTDFGIVDEILVNEGDPINPGDNLLKIRGCDHPVVMKDMCAECGADLRVECGFSGERKEQSSASVAMVHSIPELIVSEQEAVEIGKEDEARLLSQKKLVLLVDLDQTLLHTTNDPVPNNLKDVIHFQLWHGGRMIWYHTKFRPGTQSFLERISKMYELHICTFGARMYAHTMAGHLDPDGKYFSHRILSRDECFNPMSKTANLRALFPCGDSMVCIIDDREDIWSYAPHLVHVKPYRFFKGTADINAPPGCDKTNDVSEEIHADDALHQNESDKKTETETTEEKGDGDAQNVKTPDSDKGNDDDEMEFISANSETDTPEKDKMDDEIESTPTSVTTLDSSSTNETSTEPAVGKTEVMIEWPDPDDYLLYLEDILTRIHKAYYDLYAEHISKQTPTIPDLKNIIPYVKKKVLKGVNLVFSGVIPTNMPREQCKAWQLASSLGANIQEEIVRKGESATTHLVAAKLGTSKVNQALREKRVKLVSLDWIWCCAHRWEKVDERLFLLKESNSKNYGIDSPAPKSKRKLDDTDTELSNSSDKRLKLNSEASTSKDNFQDEIGPMMKFSKEDLDSMDEELHELIGSESESDSNNSDSKDSKLLENKLRKKVLSGEESDSSSADSLSGDFPKGWKHEFKRRHSWPSPKGEESDGSKSSEEEEEESQRLLRREDSDTSNEGSEVESIGSVDEEMAEAVEREFLN